MGLPYIFATLNLTQYQKDAQGNYIIPASALDDNFNYVLERTWVGTSAPTDTTKYCFWLDTSVSPNDFKIWDGTGWVNSYAGLIVRKNTGSNIGQRRRLNFIEGSNIGLTIADDGVDNEIDVTINVTGSVPQAVNSDTIDNFHASQTPQANVCAVADSNGKLQVGWLKFSTGSWSVNVDPSSYASINLVEYSHWPQQKTSLLGNSLFPFANQPGLGTSYAFILNAYNNGVSAQTWYGQYTYHSSSEQIIEVYYDEEDNIKAFHITEKNNINSIRFFDKNGKEYFAKKKAQLDQMTNPHLFNEDKMCKYTSEFLNQNKELFKKLE
uniref:Uncharacterized protein n=1 Tax=Caldisericum exile TaxID=693075 RepID=A0A7C4TV58_9BACT